LQQKRSLGAMPALRAVTVCTSVPNDDHNLAGRECMGQAGMCGWFVPALSSEAASVEEAP
jgi:hypothetical protein